MFFPNICTVPPFQQRNYCHRRVLYRIETFPTQTIHFRHLIEPNTLYCFHNRTLLLPVLSPTSQVRAIPYYKFKITSNIILPYIPWSSKWFLSFNSSYKPSIQVSQEEWTKLRESVPYVKLYRYNPKHLYPNLNGQGDNGQRSLKL